MRKHYAQLAQLVEQGTENPCVSGSIPELGISTEKCRNVKVYMAFYLLFIGFGILAQSVEHLTFNQVVRGSNPRCLMNKNGENVEKSTFSLFLCLRTFVNSCVLFIKLHLEHLKSAIQDCDYRRNMN